MEDKKLENYKNFVEALLSDTSKDFDVYAKRLADLKAQGCDISMLDTSAQGLSAESGEFQEIVKKIKYQGKPWNQDNIKHLCSELADALFYLNVGCIALGVTLADLMAMNVAKLEARYPGGKFDINSSENRREGDI